MLPAENKTVITSFVEEVINQGQLERADDLVAVDLLELDPLPGQQQGCNGMMVWRTTGIRADASPQGDALRQGRSRGGGRSATASSTQR